MVQSIFRLWKKFARELRSNNHRGHLQGYAMEEVFGRCLNVLAGFYAICLAASLAQLARVSELSTRSLESQYTLWPIQWALCVDTKIAAILITFASVLGSLGAVLFYRWQLARVTCFVTLFLLGALANSFGKINHGFHVLIWVSFIFSFSGPIFQAGRITKAEKMSLMRCVWNAQAFVLFFYSFSGLWKVYTVFLQWNAGEVTALHPEALATHIARQIALTSHYGVLGEWVVQHSIVGWPLYVGAIYLELFAICTVADENLKKAWGISLFLMHCGIGLTMDIWFIHQAAVLAVLLINSPFRHSVHGYLQTVANLPPVNVVVAYSKSIAK